MQFEECYFGRDVKCQLSNTGHDEDKEDVMIAASQPIQRPASARLMVLDSSGRISDQLRSDLVSLLHHADLVIANDAATLPASLVGTHLPTGRTVEIRLAGRGSLAPNDVHRFAAIVFGTGDFRTRTEDRPLPPHLSPGDRLQLGPLSATIERLLGHPRLISVRIDGSADEIWAGIAHHAHPIQYSHVPTPLAMWDVWTPIAGPPVAFEPPSAGFALEWGLLQQMRARGIAFATITHAAGISSTGDPELDRRLPFDEPYRIPVTTAAAIEGTKSQGGRIVAVGTTVVRALEHAARNGSVRAGDGIATQRIGAHTSLSVVDVLLSGTHGSGTTHYDLLRAFTDEATLNRVTTELNARRYHTHEFGDSVLISRSLASATQEEEYWRQTRIPTESHERADRSVDIATLT
jgi:S-adenosylmethionine:tRNA ribosyltransferase-isomerase